MGRKKKPSKSDARGYSQGPAKPNPKPSTSSLKQTTHDQMRDLLDQFSTATSLASTDSANIPSNRFPSKLSNVVFQLDELGFTEAQTERAVLALRYEITLENALDYLCLNLDTLELPPLFTEGSLREELNTETTADSLVVVSNDGRGGKNDVMEFESNVLAAPKVKAKEVNDVDNEKQKQKEWLLRQYEYEEEEEEDIIDRAGDVDGSSSQARELTSEEKELQKKEQELKELQDDLNNDANNYMRSKQEIKALQIEAKKLKQQVEGLKKKIERNQKKKAKEEDATNEEESGLLDNGDDDENCGGFFDLFGESQNEDGSSTTHIQDRPLQQSKQLLDFPIPKGWTGTTPEKKLDEVCRKQKLPRPKYTKLPRSEGYRLSATVAKNRPQMELEALANDFLRGSSLKDYLATHALYEIDCTLPLHQIFPPAFRKLWISWENQKTDEKSLAKKELDETKQKRIDRLVSLIANLQSDKIELNDPVEDENEGTNELKTEYWDDDENDIGVSNLGLESNIEPTSAGKQLQKDFRERLSTAPYLKMKATRDNLPMASFREQILKTVRENAVTILAAETGAGKTTQCPQFLLEEALLSGYGDKTHLLCTQPRRVAAISVAERVAEEMCDALGKNVGYQIRMEAKKSAQTKLLFCTTGIVLRRLQDDPNLAGVTHVLVDEVHERQQQTDVLLIILRQLLTTTRPDLKVILMSATLDSELFCSFFNGAPLISVPGRTFPVENYFLEDLIEATNHVIEEGSKYAKFVSTCSEQTSLLVTQRGGDKRKEIVDLTSSTDPIEVSCMYESYSMSTRRSMQRVDEEVINFDLVEDILKLLLVGDVSSRPFGVDLSTGSILVFLPGLGEIKSMVDRLDGSRHLNSNHFEIIPLHSTLSSRDQRRAFIPSKLRKIILSTNIAETSVTIPDVVCVIDAGRVKEVRKSKRFLTSQLVTDWCSKASAKQRAGRAGRVKSGIALKLYSSHTANHIMQKASLPELQRVPLEEICLSILASGFAKSCRDFLSQAPQPPPSENLQAALTVLQDIGALQDVNGQEYLTPLGKHLAKLPVNVRLGKMLLLASIFNCIDPVLTIAASLSSQSPFSTFMSDAATARAKQKALSDPDSDFITYCNVWRDYSKACNVSSSSEKAFCREQFLNQASLREISSARKQFIDLLSGIGFLHSPDGRKLDEEKLKTSPFNRQSKNIQLVHAVICAGLYPNIGRLDQDLGSGNTLWHKNERLYFHSSSVNASKKRYALTEKWIVFDEKFGTAKRTSVSTTAFIHPLALILFGGCVIVKHVDRLVLVDDWIEIKMAAQTGVLLREIKKQVDNVLRKMIDRANIREIDATESSMIDQLCKILTM